MAPKAGWVTYITDEGNSVSIKASANTAAQNGVSVSLFPTNAGTWGWNHKDLRHFCGVAADGSRSKIVVLTEARYDPAAIGGLTFQNSKGVTFTLTSKIGERQPAQDAR
jgi:hypothetical protein